MGLRVCIPFRPGLPAFRPVLRVVSQPGRSASGEMAYDGVAGADAAVYPRLFIGGVLRTWLDEKPEALLSALHPRTLQPIHVSSQLLHRSGVGSDFPARLPPLDHVLPMVDRNQVGRRWLGLFCGHGQWVCPCDNVFILCTGCLRTQSSKVSRMEAISHHPPDGTVCIGIGAWIKGPHSWMRLSFVDAVRSGPLHVFFSSPVR